MKKVLSPISVTRITTKALIVADMKSFPAVSDTGIRAPALLSNVAMINAAQLEQNNYDDEN